jgi:MOSC domain-containing protein YiiM
MHATVTGLFVRRERKGPRESQSEAHLIADHGIRGDAYAGPGDRQVVLFEDAARAALAAAQEQGLCYARFYENVRVEGLDLGSLTPGDRLSIGHATVEITSARKRCYAECSLSPGECLIRGHLAFARVVAGGTVSVGAAVAAASDSGAGS